MYRALPALMLVSIVGCKPPPQDADELFNTSAVFVLTDFEGSAAELADAVRTLEEVIYNSVDLGASGTQNRALTPRNLTEEDVEGIETNHERAPEDNLAVSLAAAAPHDIDDHRWLPLLEEQVLVEPYSPNQYIREFVDGTEECWAERQCDILRTQNNIIKENALMTVRYDLEKQYRWVDLNLPEPRGGQEPVNEGEPRWAFVSRSWSPDSAPGESGNATIQQSYSMELWLPRDGGGFLRDGPDPETGFTDDSSGGGIVRLMTTWAETDLGFDPGENAVIGTTRQGMDKIFDAQNEWVGANKEAE